MFDFVIFTFFSSFEYLAIIYFGFVLFRITLRQYTFHMLFIACVLSYVSYTLRFAGFDFVAPITQMIVLFLFIWLMFRIQVFYASVIAITGYLVFMLVQGVFIIALVSLGMVTFEQLQPNTVIGVSIQIGTVALMMLLARLIEHLNWGFDFVPHSEFAQVKLKNENRVLLIVILLSFLSFGATYSILFYKDAFVGFPYLVTVNLIVIVLLIYFARKRDKSED